MSQKKAVKPGSARKAKQATVNVKVVADVFGLYKKGDTLQMSKSTAAACVANKVVSYSNTKS